MEKIEISIGDFHKIDISETPKSISLNTIFKKGGLCLPYAVLCARQNTGVDIIEGLVLVVPKDKEKFESGVIKHAWNFKNDIYFDLTKENVWGDEYEKLFYFPILKKEESEYGKENVDFDNLIINAKIEIETQIDEYKKSKETND
jgi:hypothetical protein